MEENKSIFMSCSQSVGGDEPQNEGVTIMFVQPKNIDLRPFAMLKAIGSLTGLTFGDYQLPPASNVLFVDGSKNAAGLLKDIKSCECECDQDKVQLLSMKTYNAATKASLSDPDVPVTDSIIVDKIVGHAQAEDQLCVILHDLQSLTAGGTLCKPANFRDLHNRLKAVGALQLYFVNSEAEATQIAVKPDLVFNINKVSDAILPTIRMTLSSSSARIQDAILPLELELEFAKDGAWKVEESIKRKDLEEAIKALALMGKKQKEIAAMLSIPPTTVHRRLHAMQDQGELIINGHSVTRA